MAKIRLRHTGRTTDRDKDGYFKYEPRGGVPPGGAGRHGVYIPKNWISTRPPAEIARQLSERNIGAVLFAGSETGETC